VALLVAQTGDTLYDSHAGSPTFERAAQQAACQDDAYAVGRGEGCVVENIAEGRVGAALHHKLRVDCTYLVKTWRLLAEETLYLTYGFVFAAVVYADAQYVVPPQKALPLRYNAALLKYITVGSNEQ
jgi:hypothetical protein